MKKRFPLREFGACVGMLLLILDSKTALAGAQTGVDLIINTVIPALFPFFFLSSMLLSSQDTDSFSILRPIGRLFRIPDGMETLLIPSFLGGYPAGAHAVFTAWRQDRISKESSEKALCFCSNAGPSFIFGILPALFSDMWMCWLLWGLQILGAFISARLFFCDCTVHFNHEVTQPRKALPDILANAMGIMGAVCGWLLLFRIVLAFTEKWLFQHLSQWGHVLISGFLELTNGCCMLYQIQDLRLRFTVCSLMLSAGGLCVLLQTRSVTKGLSLKWYYLGKCFQSLFCCFASVGIFYNVWFPLLLLLAAVFLGNKYKKTVAFHKYVVYNGTT